MTELRFSGPARPGDVLGGRYRLEELIGEGGMGSVWRASDRVLGRTVAVKVFWSGVSDEADATRRQSEKRLLASVSHPSLVTLFDAHLSHDGHSYLVMEHIDGGTLSTLIGSGPVAPLDAASLATDLGEALHVVHTAGIIHRDVKPANILLRPPLTPAHTFRAVLADFGIAYVVDATRVTTPGMAIGTAAYISPEQVRGHAPTPASDIYSLGLVLLEALSGVRAFPAQTPVEAIAVRLANSPDIPGHWGYGWRSLLSEMTRLDPEQRPTALEVARRGRELDRVDAEPLSTLPVAIAAPAAGPPTQVTALLGTPVAPVSAPVLHAPTTRRDTHQRRIRAARRRRSALGGGVLAAAAAVVALTVWLGASASPAPPAEGPLVDEPASSEPVPVLSLAPEPSGAPVVSDTGAGTSDSGGRAPDAGTAGTANENAGPGNNSSSDNAGSGNNSGSGAGSNGGNGGGQGNGGKGGKKD